MFVDDLFNKKTLTESNGGGSPWHSEPEQQQMDADRRGRLGRERNAGLDEPDDAAAGAAPTGNGVYEYTVPAGQESTAQELGLQQHRGHWVSRVPIQRANFQFGRPQFHEISSQGVAEGSLNELSKDTLKSYAKKAVPDMKASQDKSKSEYSKAAAAKDDKDAEKHYDAAKQAKDRTEKRMAGVTGAIKRFNKEGVAEGMLDNPGAQDSPVASAIIRRILLQRTDLLSKYGPEKVGAAVDEVADFVGDVDEIGSSDVSGWIRHVEQMLGNMGEQGMAEAGYPEVDHMPGKRGIGLDSAKPRDTYVKTFHASKEKEAQEFAKKNGYIVKKHVYPKSANNSQPHEFQVHKNEQGVAEGAHLNEVFNIVPNLAQQIEKKEDELKALKAKMAARTTTNAGIQTGATALIDPDTDRPYEKDKLAAMYGYKEPEAAADDAQADETPPAPVAQTPAQIRAAKQKAAAATAQSQMAGAAPAPVAQTPAATTATNPVGFNAGNVMKLPGMEKYAKPAAPAKTANFAGPSGYGKTTTSIKPPAAPSSPALAVPKVPAAPRITSGGPTPAEKANLDKRIAAAAAAPAVAETLAQVDRMLESVNSKKSADMIRAYVDQRFTELGLRNTTECRNIMARVVQESAIRRRQYAKSLAK